MKYNHFKKDCKILKFYKIIFFEIKTKLTKSCNQISSKHVSHNHGKYLKSC